MKHKTIYPERWKYTINLADVFHSDTLTFEQKRDVIVERLRNSQWFKTKGEFDDLPQFVDELAGTSDEDAFDGVWSSIYDEADADRVWIKTVGGR